jgi:hypothetical protein
MSPNHLKQIDPSAKVESSYGKMEKYYFNHKFSSLLSIYLNLLEQQINFLMEIALKKLSFLPFGYLMDKYRWQVFRGEINSTNYNEKWWEMR